MKDKYGPVKIDQHVTPFVDKQKQVSKDLDDDKLKGLFGNPT
jgi:hypothetical protein